MYSIFNVCVLLLLEGFRDGFDGFNAGVVTYSPIVDIWLEDYFAEGILIISLGSSVEQQELYDSLKENLPASEWPNPSH